MADARDVEDA